MFGFFKKIFAGKEVNKSQQKQMIDVKNILLENKRMKEELDWFYSLGLPDYSMLDDGFDYYNYLKEEIEVLRRDKIALTKQNIKMHKKLKQQTAIENIYLQKINALNSNIAYLKNEVDRLSPVTRTSSKKERTSDVDDYLNKIEEKEIEVRKMEEERELEDLENKRPFERIRSKLKRLNKNNLNTYA